MARQRRKPITTSSDTSFTDGESRVAASMTTTPDTSELESTGWSVRTQWIFFAIASGVCAAFNGAFAKLTTTDLTTSISHALASFLHLAENGNDIYVEYAVRGTFLILNFVFNGVMWSLFTTALARGTSATQVSIMNTSTNFIVTALLGMIIFTEKLPPLWWLGASLLVVGNVIAGRKGDGDDKQPDNNGYGALSQEEPAEGEEAAPASEPVDGDDD